MCDGSGLLLHKRKDGSAQRILYHILGLYRYTTHKRRREMGLGAGLFKKKHMN
ncbi:hypothetical protein [Bartonella sp. MU70NMGDW]|uniref:hypothetical protein n=1 Tax=Bartonella sp. MU70NMGDW TaxID=3243561 RepID=UPI0035CF41B3